MQATIQGPRPSSSECIIDHRMRRSLPRKGPSSIARRVERGFASGNDVARYSKSSGAKACCSAARRGLARLMRTLHEEARAAVAEANNGVYGPNAPVVSLG